MSYSIKDTREMSSMRGRGYLAPLYDVCIESNQPESGYMIATLTKK